jgi:hypothetical protein
MFWPALLLSGISAIAQGNSAKNAASAQSAASMAGIEEQKRQFDEIRKLMAPYVTGGTAAFGQQGDLAGVNGADKQQAAIQGIQNGPQFGAMVQQGENAMRQNAAATGGLRGGNFQGALAQFRPQVLSSLIDQRFSQLGGLASAGLSAAGAQGVAGQNAANQISAGYGQIGQAQAGQSLAVGNAIGGFASGIGGYIGQFGMPQTGPFNASSWGF